MNKQSVLSSLQYVSLLLVLLLIQPARADESAQPTAKAGWSSSREKDVPAYELPDPLLLPDGTRIESAKAWEAKGRPETLEQFRTFVYGRRPNAPDEVKFETISTDPEAMDGKAVHKRVRIIYTQEGKSFSFEASLLLPAERSGAVPVFLLINHRPVTSADPTRKTKDDFWPAEQIIARGYGAAVFQAGDVDRDRAAAEARAGGARALWPQPTGSEDDAWGTIAAWAWGASRVMDYLETDADVDAQRVAVVGHSRGGKTALWAGAEDERFGLVISNNSGCTGAAISRRRFGETLEVINRVFPHWFCKNYKQFNDREHDLPIDQHQLVALIAPRAAYVASSDKDFWADQRGEYLATAHAAPVYRLYGYEGLDPEAMPPLDTPVAAGRTGYHIRTGSHGMTPYDWQRFMDFADNVWGSSKK